VEWCHIAHNAVHLEQVQYFYARFAALISLNSKPRYMISAGSMNS